MKSLEGNTIHWKQVLRDLWPMPLLLLLYWIIRYWHYGDFGFYEDDHHYVLRAINMSNSEFVRYLFDLGHIVRFYDAGHPLHPRFITLGTKIGWWLGELQGLYWISFLIGSINISLFFLLIRRVHSNALGVIATTIYVLFSADTTQAYLTFALGLQPSITFLLIAAHLYLAGNRWTPYGLAILSLFTYETVFPIFFALPLLGGIDIRKNFKEFRVHLVKTSLILVAIIIWRALVGENRLEQLTFTDILTTPILHSIQGPLVSLGTYLYRPIQTIQFFTPELLLICAILTVGFSILMLKVNPPTVLLENSKASLNLHLLGIQKRSVLFARQIWDRMDQQGKSLVWLAFTGLVMLVLAYPLTFTVRAFAISGRDTRVHAAGVLGAAILLGSITLLLLALVRNRRAEKWIVVTISIWLSLLAGFGLIIQNDYSLAWQYQREFWSSITPFIPDLEEETIILVDPAGLDEPRFIAANTWSLPNVLKYLYVFPDDWETAPRVHRLLPSWKERVLTNTAEIKALDYKWEYVVVTWEHIILLETRNGVVSNRLETITLDAVEYSLDPMEKTPSLSVLESSLHPYFIDP